MQNDRKRFGSSGSTRSAIVPLVRVWLLLVSAAIAGCGAREGDINDAHNSRDTGDYQVLGRQSQDDSVLVLHVLARRPQNARAIAQELVEQSYALSPSAITVIVDPAAGGDRQVFHWDASGLRAGEASAHGAMPRPTTDAPPPH
ncbi:hypothetical protein [Luteitalea sp.]